jgi:hypothetical protein
VSFSLNLLYYILDNDEFTLLELTRKNTDIPLMPRSNSIDTSPSPSKGNISKVVDQTQPNIPKENLSQKDQLTLSKKVFF